MVYSYSKRGIMFTKCPSCNKYNSFGYKGVYCLEKPYYKVFQCNNSTCNKYYTIEIRMGSRQSAVKLTTKRDIDYFLEKRVACPLCTKFKKKIKYRGSLRKPLDTTDLDYEYKYVMYMGELQKTEQNKFYCNNHRKSPFRQKYQFVKNIHERQIMSLGKYIKESSSQSFYNKVKEVYKEGKGKYSFTEDPKNILSKLYTLGIPQTLLARIFHTSQPTIYRLIKRKKFNEAIHTLYIEKKHSSLFYTQIKISKQALSEIKTRWKKSLLNP